MNPANLIPLKNLDKQTLVQLFRNNDNFAWNVRNWNEANDTEYVMEVMTTLQKKGAKLSECEFGLYTPVRFYVVHTPYSMRDFSSGVRKIQEDYCFLPDSCNPIVEQAQREWDAYANNIDPEKDDYLLEKISTSVGLLEVEIREAIRKTFSWLENDSNIEETIEDYAECEWHSLWYDPSDQSVYEIDKVKQLSY